MTDLTNTKASDEEALPFKMAFVLSHELGLRLFIEPEACHSQYNDCRNSLRRCGLQHTLLLSATMSNAAHGPFAGGRNKWTLDEAAESLTRMSTNDFADLVDLMAEDLGCDPEDTELLPESPADIPLHRSLKNLPPFVTPQESNDNWMLAISSLSFPQREDELECLPSPW